MTKRKKESEKKRMGPPRAIDKPEKLKDAYLSYLTHLSKGKSKRSWVYEKDETFIAYEQLEVLANRHPDLLDPKLISIARSKGFYKWEEVVEDGAIGKNKNVNANCLAMLMRNKYGWDKREDAKHYDPEGRARFDQLMDLLRGRQGNSQVRVPSADEERFEEDMAN
jgi:hypothetical protein